MNNKIEPVIMGLGGKKRVIVKYLNDLLPKEYNNYYEPFVGGAAMLLHLQPKKALINDINTELIITYKLIKNDPYALMLKIDEYRIKHSLEYFFETRSKKIKNMSDIEIASRFLYLNKSCFSGMYRVNSSGQFNTAINRDKLGKELIVYKKENLINFSKYLNENDIKIVNLNYIDVMSLPVKNDFVFLDPPYDYEIGVTGFNAYNESSFNSTDQINLCNKLKELDKQGVKGMITNHSTKLIKDLYKDYKQVEISVPRTMGKIKQEKKHGNEIVIMNY